MMMASNDLAMNLVGKAEISVDMGKDLGPVEMWRHTYEGVEGSTPSRCRSG